MRKMALLFGIGAAAILAGPSANAASSDAVKAQIEHAKVDTVQATDVSARRRVYRRHYRQVYRPYYGQSYGYYPQRYYSPGPAISFSFGGGGYRHGGWGRHW